MSIEQAQVKIPDSGLIILNPILFNPNLPFTPLFESSKLIPDIGLIPSYFQNFLDFMRERASGIKTKPFEEKPSPGGRRWLNSYVIDERDILGILSLVFSDDDLHKKVYSGKIPGYEREIVLSARYQDGRWLREDNLDIPFP